MSHLEQIEVAAIVGSVSVALISAAHILLDKFSMIANTLYDPNVLMSLF